MTNFQGHTFPFVVLMSVRGEGAGTISLLSMYNCKKGILSQMIPCVTEKGYAFSSKVLMHEKDGTTFLQTVYMPLGNNTPLHFQLIFLQLQSS